MQEKSKQTLMEKYGVEHPLYCEAIKNKLKETNKDRYGVECVLKSHEIQTKIKQRNMEKCGRNHISQLHIKHYDIWIDDNKFKELIEDTYNKHRSFLRLNDFTQFFNVIPQSIKMRVESLGLLNYFYIQQSNIEICFREFLDKHSIIYKNRRNSLCHVPFVSIFTPYRPIPERQLAPWRRLTGIQERDSSQLN